MIQTETGLPTREGLFTVFLTSLHATTHLSHLILNAATVRHARRVTGDRVTPAFQADSSWMFIAFGPLPVRSGSVSNVIFCPSRTV